LKGEINIINIDWKPDKNLNKPLYIQIVEYFKEKINGGEWQVGFMIPTQRELAKIFNVNRSTIVSAIDELKAEGILEGKGKGGTKIVNNVSPLLSNIQPDWKSYIDEGIHIPNVKTIKKINTLEFREDYIRLSTGEPSSELFPKEDMKIILNEVAKDMDNLGYESPSGTMYLRQQVRVLLYC